MIRQTLAIFLDAYRELNARKLFWFVLILSGLVVGAFAAVGINERGITVLRWEFEIPFNTSVVSREQFYKMLFTTLGISFWLAWIATILALVSTAGIFPDFVSGGSIDLFLCKPISRLRLFLTKYATGLLFVTLQVAVFSAASYLVIGLRSGAWVPGLFISVPVVVCFFSYLYCVCVLIGLLTRSTIAALLLTILFWFLVFGVHVGELAMLKSSVRREQEIARLDRGVARVRQEIAAHDAPRSTTGPAPIAEASAARRQFLQTRLDAAEQQREGVRNPWKTPHRIFLALKAVLPKTSETIELLNRWLVLAADLPEPEPETTEEDKARDFLGRTAADAAADAAVAKIVAERSVGWVLGTSLAFEGVVLFLAGWIFCRRDY